MFTTDEHLNRESDFQTPYVDLSFPVIGQILPADHGYGLYAALTHWREELHNLEGLSIQTITGIPDQRGKIYLSDRSILRLRLPYDQVPYIYPLAGKFLRIGKHRIGLGIPQIFTLKSASELYSRLVVIKGYQEPESFLEAAQRQLQKLGINGIVKLSENASGQIERKTIKIKQYTVVGFSLEVEQLSPNDSLLLQKVGLGGKQRMGFYS